MFTAEERERFRRAYYLDHKSLRQIAQEEGHSREAIARAISDLTLAPPSRSRRCPVLGPYQAQIEELLTRNERLPKKQRYTAHRIFALLQADGYQGCESSIRHAVSAWKRAQHRPEVFLPLEFDPGQDAQVDWVRRVGAYEIPA